MTALFATTRLHVNKREISFLVPLYITATVAVLSVLTSLLFLRSGSVPGSADWVAGSQANPGLMYALSGFLVYLGVQSVATTFPFALTLGSTRKSFVGGTLLWSVLVSTYLTVVFAILAMIEIATGHWFSGFYVFDVNILGAGNLAYLVPIVFLTSLSLLTVGGVFGASWVRLGARGPQLLGTGIALVIIVALIIFLPSAPAILAAFQPWWLAVVAAVVIALSSSGTWLLLRSAIVR